jgi:hypothetical protein
VKSEEFIPNVNPKENAFLSKFFILGCFIFCEKEMNADTMKRNERNDLIDSIT